MFEHFCLCVFARGECDEVFDSSLYLERTVWFVFAHAWISRAVPFSVKMISRELIRYIRMRCSASRALNLSVARSREFWFLKPMECRESSLFFPIGFEKFPGAKAGRWFILFVFGKVRALLYASQEYRPEVGNLFATGGRT